MVAAVVAAVVAVAPLLVGAVADRGSRVAWATLAAVVILEMMLAVCIA